MEILNYFRKHIGIIKFTGGVNKQNCEKFRKDFNRLIKNKTRLEALIFIINSPGGSVVHSNIISSSIRRFASENKIKLSTFTESMAVSGGYYLLCVGDKVYARKNSLIGSIGAVFTTFEFKSLLDRFEIEKKSYCASEVKDDMRRVFDPFTIKTEKDIEKLSNLSNEVFKGFKNHVLKYRKLTDDKKLIEDIFNANIYIGEEAKSLGLIDLIYDDYREVVRKEYPKFPTYDYSSSNSLEFINKLI